MDKYWEPSDTDIRWMQTYLSTAEIIEELSDATGRSIDNIVGLHAKKLADVYEAIHRSETLGFEMPRNNLPSPLYSRHIERMDDVIRQLLFRLKAHGSSVASLPVLMAEVRHRKYNRWIRKIPLQWGVSRVFNKLLRFSGINLRMLINDVAISAMVDRFEILVRQRLNKTNNAKKSQMTCPIAEKLACEMGECVYAMRETFEYHFQKQVNVELKYIRDGDLLD